MAVNVSTITSVCVYCKANSNSVIEQDFHEIYDEVGLELQLPALVETYFQLKVENEGKQYLCDACVNRLIELYDLQEHAKEKAATSECHKAVEIASIQPAEENTKNTDKVSYVAQAKCAQQSGLIMDNIFQLEDQNSSENEPTYSTHEVNLHKEFSAEHRRLQPKSVELSNDDEVLFQQTKIKTNVDCEGDNFESTAFTLEHIEDDIDEDFTDEDFAIDNVFEESQELTTLSSNSTIEISNSSEIDESQEVFINDNNSDNLFHTNKNQVDQLSETENQSATNDQDDVINNDMYEPMDETLVNSDKTYEHIDDDREMVMSDMFHCDDNDNNQNKATTEADQNIVFNEIAYIDIGANSAAVGKQGNNETVILTLNSKEADCQLSTIEGYESTEHFDKSQEELSNDSLSLEEEYLIEEIICSEEYDEIDLNEYLDKVLVTKFQDLEFNWQTECKLCLSLYNTFEELLRHSCLSDLEEEQQFCCTIKNCDHNADNLAALARHLIFIHYDKLESVAIYGKCPDCQKTFSNIFDFNKHSCCRNIKRKTGSPNYCQYCDMDFQSLRRYVFHMQFHLTNRRPKVCLLCGILFKTSNDFFEHTQYQHVPETAMACIKCDRFFKDKDVFDQHISSHDTKYQYSCTICPKKYTNKFILAQHMDIYHSNRPSTMKCKHCEKEFVSRISYRNHIKCHDTDIEVEAFICSTCGIVTSSMERIKYHIESDEDSPCFASQIEEKILSLVYTCENCSLDYHTIKDLKQHRLSGSHSDDLFVCGICRQSFKTLRHMRNHYTNHKDLEEWKTSFPVTRYFVCNIGDCQEFYPIWTTLYYHKKRPHKTNTSSSADEFKCQFCQQICSTKMSLAVHVARSHNNSNVKCSYCKRSFKSQKHLQEHIDRYHTPVECDICFKKFKHRRNLESHNNMVHLSIKRYFCKHCDKGYFHKSEKDIHEKKVHPKASYNCELCDFVTTYPESLQIHMDKHNNQLKFKCTICGKEFGRKQLLQCHLKRHLNKKDFICFDYLKEEGCDSTFLTYHLLKKHIETKHPHSACGNKLRSGNKMSKALQHHAEADEIEDNSFELWLDEGTASETHNNNEDFDLDPIELVFEEDDVQFDEQ